MKFPGSTILKILIFLPIFKHIRIIVKGFRPFASKVCILLCTDAQVALIKPYQFCMMYKIILYKLLNYLIVYDYKFALSVFTNTLNIIYLCIFQVTEKNFR